MKPDLHEASYVPFYQRISYLYIPALFVVITVLLEVSMFALMHLAFPPAYIFSLTIILIIAALVALLPKKWMQTVICSLLLGMQLTTTISNIIANDACMEIFSLETFKSMATAFDNTGSIKLNYGFLLPIIALILIYVVGLVLIMWFCRTPKGDRRYYQWRHILCGALAFVSFFSYTVAYAGSPNYQRGINSYVANLSNQKFLYETFGNRVSSLRTFGSYSFYLDNFLALLGGKTAVTDVMKISVTEDSTADSFVLNQDEVLGDDYNLIMVLMETFEREAINPITMPNLYQFMLESCVDVDGFYSIERTCFTDYIGQTGMHVWGKELWNNYGGVAVPHSLANIFNRSDKNYQTTAFHSSDDLCYNRGEIFTETLGFQSFNDFTTYTKEDERYTEHCGLNSDQLLFERNLEKIAPADQNFYSYVISVSTHSTNASMYNLADYYPELYAEIDWDALAALYPVLSSDDRNAVLTAKNYLFGTYSFDLGFGALLDYLKTTDDELHAGKKLIETTALLLFGDHYYYVNPDAIKAENDNPRGLVGNRSPFIVYNPRAKTNTGKTQAENIMANLALPNAERVQCGTTMYRFTSTMDLYPTVCSMFGIVTDQQMTYGHSIFDTDAESIGVGYLNGLTWGALGHDDLDNATEMTSWGAPKANWQIWRTLDFVNFNGVTLTAAQIADVTPLVNQTYASIFLNTTLFNHDGFKNLAKSHGYQLGKSKII